MKNYCFWEKVPEKTTYPNQDYYCFIRLLMILMSNSVFTLHKLLTFTDVIRD